MFEGRQVVVVDLSDFDVPSLSSSNPSSTSFALRRTRDFYWNA